MSYRRCLSLKVHPNAFSLIVAGVKVSNAERIIDEATGIRKIDLVRYYDEIAEFALPYLRDRPVSLVRAPSGIDSGDVIRGVRDRFGITIANGQGELKGKIFRLGHIGWFDVFDITTQIGAVELVLAELGADVERGVAVTAALEAFEAASVAGEAADAPPEDTAAVGGGGSEPSRT